MKSDIIAEKTREADERYSRMIKEVERKMEGMRAVLRNALKTRILELKNKKMDQIMQKVKCKLAEMNVRESLVFESMKWVNDNIGGYYAICAQRDTKLVAITGMGIEELPISALGGIIICSKDGRIFCDNCFRTRLDM